MSADLSATGLRASDAALASADFDKYFKAANDAQIEATAAALKAKGHVVHVVASKEEALKVLVDLVPKGSSISSGNSTTLHEIGYTEYLKEHDADYVNYKGQAVAAMNAGDWATYGAKTAQGYTADYFVTGCSAVTEAGEILSADATGTRIGGLLTAKNAVVVTGSNKIVSNWAEAEKRLNEFQFAVESARVRVVYKAPSSTIANTVAIKAGNPFAQQPRVTVVLIRGCFGY